MTFSARGCALSLFLQEVARQAGVSVVASSKFDAMTVDVELVAVPVSEALQAIARRVGGQVARVGSVFYLGELRPEDRGILVRACSRLSRDELVTWCAALVSEAGRSAVTADGVMVLADRVEVLERVSRALDDLEAAPAESWVCQLYIVGISEAKALQFGLDVVPTAQLSASSLSSSGAAAVNSWRALFSAKGALTWTSSDSGVSLVAEPTFVLVDGLKGNYHRGVTIPVAKKTVSPEGTVSVSGYDQVETGFTAAVTCRAVGGRRARVDLDIRDSQVSGYVNDEAPIVDSEQTAGGAYVESGQMSLLLSVMRKVETKKQDGVLGLVAGRHFERQRLMVWCLLYRAK